jgi:energy-coupling factor transport system permease protein
MTGLAAAALGAARPTESSETSLVGRASPLVKAAIALAWLVGLALSLDPRPPLLLALAAIAGGSVLGRIPLRRMLAWMTPLWLGALGLAAFNALFAAANADPGAAEAFHWGPLRLTEPALTAGLALGLRVLAIASISAVFVLTTSPTRLADALVQQAHLPARFAYGALAAYQAIPRLADDLADLRAARRARGLRGGWHPRVLLGLLVLAIRHADRLALAMDARAFGIGRRSAYREVRVTWRDPAVLALGLAVLLLGLLAGGTLGP